MSPECESGEADLLNLNLDLSSSHTYVPFQSQKHLTSNKSLEYCGFEERQD